MRKNRNLVQSEWTLSKDLRAFEKPFITTNYLLMTVRKEYLPTREWSIHLPTKLSNQLPQRTVTRCDCVHLLKVAETVLVIPFPVPVPSHQNVEFE